MMEKALFFFFFLIQMKMFQPLIIEATGEKKKNQFSFQRKAFVFALMQTGEIWQHI